MKSLATKLLRWFTALMPPLICAWIIIDMMQQGDWIWLACLFALMAVLLVIFGPMMEWYFERRSTNTKYDIIKRENEELRYRLAQRHEEDRP